MLFCSGGHYPRKVIIAPGAEMNYVEMSGNLCITVSPSTAKNFF
jgi:hypothetical protein